MKKTEKVKVSEQVRLYRALKRLSQTEFGELCGISQRAVSLIENEEFERVSIETLNKAQKTMNGGLYE